MRQVITVSLTRDLAHDLNALTAQEGLSRSEVVRESLKEYLWLRRFRALRRRVMPKAQARGIYTDQDVFDHVS
jgi:metal-responsive CopG/Arc/MetJ family transcriptional regulator